MPDIVPRPLHAFLAGIGPDSRGRYIGDVLGLPDAKLEEIHDYIQWLFPLETRSGAQPNAPVLSESEIQAIRGDKQAADNIRQATERMLHFYRNTQWWLTWQDHNHLRITRIIRSLRLLAGSEEARRFYDEILALHQRAGAPVNPRSLQFWEEAVKG